MQCTCFSMPWLLLSHYWVLSTQAQYLGHTQGLSCPTACGIFPDQGWNPCPLNCRWILNHWLTREVHPELLQSKLIYSVAYITFPIVYMRLKHISEHVVLPINPIDFLTKYTTTYPDTLVRNQEVFFFFSSLLYTCNSPTWPVSSLFKLGLKFFLDCYDSFLITHYFTCPHRSAPPTHTRYFPQSIQSDLFKMWIR